MSKNSNPVHRKTKKAPRRKISLKQILIIILVILISLVFLLFSFYSPNRDRSAITKPLSSTKSTTSFRKDGTLTIVQSNKHERPAFDIEIADNEEERMRGLMDRQSMPENEGMLFIFTEDAPRSFWMKNTFISLDIIYINSDKEIVNIQKYTQPKSTYSIPSEKPAMYVLEVNAGITDKLDINPGDKIEYYSNQMK